MIIRVPRVTRGVRTYTKFSRDWLKRSMRSVNEDIAPVRKIGGCEDRIVNDGAWISM